MSNLHLIHIIRHLSHSIFIPFTLSITQPLEAIIASPSNIKVLSANVLQERLKMQDRASVWTGHSAAVFAVLVPRSALVRPDCTFEVLLLVNVVVGD